MTKKIILLIFLFVITLTKLSFSQTLLPADEKTLDSVKQANKGNVILFNFWATWCKPCVEEFPDLVKLNKKFKDKNFKLVFVSLDIGDALKTETPAFLKKQGVDFATYYNGFNKDEDLINYMDKGWEGSIPGTFIFDKEGKLQKTLIGKQDYDDFKEAVNKYIN